MSHYDYSDPGTDPAYCDGLTPDDDFVDEARTIRQVPTRAGLTSAQLRELVMHADPRCPECHGEGWLSVTTQQHADGYTDVRCRCVEPLDDERPTTEHGV